jgi:predicted nucleic acid-binding protein
MNALDTNVWIYCHDRRDPRKQKIAQQLVETVRPMALVWQVGCEFIAAARKLEPFGFPLSAAWEALGEMQTMADTVVLPKVEFWPRCRALQRQYGLQFWDALIVVACLSDRVTTLYSEDLCGRDGVENLKIVNPFAAGS